MTYAGSAERAYNVPFVRIDDGEVSFYVFDEKLQKEVLNEEVTRILAPEFVEDFKMTDEYRPTRGDKDKFYSDDPGWQDDRARVGNLKTAEAHKVCGDVATILARPSGG